MNAANAYLLDVLGMLPAEFIGLCVCLNEPKRRLSAWQCLWAAGYLFAILVIGPTNLAVAEERVATATAAEKTFQSAIASPEDIARWIGELGHETFTVRQTAASQLLAAGMSAREALVAVADGPDPETRAAARRLIAQIDHSEFHRRLEAFAADTEGRQGISLPGWDQYQKLVGGDPPARALFVEMQRQEGGLLRAMFGLSKRTPGDLLDARLMRLIQWPNVAGNRTASPPLGSCAAVLFLGSIAEIEVSDNAAQLIEVLLQRPPILESLRADKTEEPVRRLVVGWVLHCPSKNEEILRRRLNLISAMAMKEALPLALNVLGGEAPFRRVHPFTRAQAALVVGQLGGREHVDKLEPLLEDSSMCSPQAQLPGQAGATVQVRDVALVMMIHLTDQRPADYGYLSARPQPQSKAYSLQTLFRENNQQRDEAIAKWRKWRSSQKGAGSPEKPAEKK
jgi:hypothetical protein